MKKNKLNAALTATTGAATTTYEFGGQHHNVDQISASKGEPMVAISALCNIAIARAEYQLTFGFNLPGFIFVTKAGQVGTACPDTESSVFNFENFIESLRLLGKAHNVTDGVFFDFLEVDKDRDRRGVHLMAQTHEMDANIILPVHFKPDGTFSNFDLPIKIEPLPWLEHIVPAADTNAAAQEAALAALKGRPVTIAF